MVYEGVRRERKRGVRKESKNEVRGGSQSIAIDYYQGLYF